MKCELIGAVFEIRPPRHFRPVGHIVLITECGGRIQIQLPDAPILELAHAQIEVNQKLKITVETIE